MVVFQVHSILSINNNKIIWCYKKKTYKYKYIKKHINLPNIYEVISYSDINCITSSHSVITLEAMYRFNRAILGSQYRKLFIIYQLLQLFCINKYLCSIYIEIDEINSNFTLIKSFRYLNKYKINNKENKIDYLFNILKFWIYKINDIIFKKKLVLI